MGNDDVILLIARLPLALPLFALILVRVSGLMLTAPLFGSQVIPMRIRAMLAVSVTIVLFPMLAPKMPAQVSLAAAVRGLASELSIGLIMGMGLGLLFVGVELMGMVVGQQAGLSLGQVFDPSTGSSSTTIGRTVFIIAMFIFMVAGGHRELLRAVLDTYGVIPVMSFRYDASMLDLFVDLLHGAFIVALRLAGPVLVTLILASLVMGFLSRTIPQFNILSVGFAIRVLTALFALALTIAASQGVVTDALADFVDRLREGFGLPQR